MDNTTPVMLRLISCAVRIASSAGEVVRNITNSGNLNVVDKGVQDFQTEADRTAQRLIVASLGRKFPKCTIVGEETLAEDKAADERLFVDDYDQDILKMKIPDEYRHIKEEDVTIWVDPLDGTSEYVRLRQVSQITTLIGFSIAGRSIAGVIHQPFYPNSQDANSLGRTIWGLVGLGCYGIEAKSPEANKFIITTTSSHGNKIIDDCVKSLSPDEIMKVGGAGNKVLYIMEGKVHAYVFPSHGSKRWDTGAPEAILKSLGGCLTDVFGNPIEYDSKIGNYDNFLGVVAALDPKIHSRIIENIPTDCKNHLVEYYKAKF